MEESFLSLSESNQVFKTLNCYPEFDQSGLNGWNVAGATREEWFSVELLQKVKDFLIKKDPYWSNVFSS
jgi:hypothetical protein